MGLKKPIKTGTVLPSLDELISVDTAPVESGGYVVLDTVPGQACTMESNTPISIKAELGKFGNASAADVASGKTFTSAAGLKVAGTMTTTTSFDSQKCEKNVEYSLNLQSFSKAYLCLGLIYNSATTMIYEILPNTDTINVFYDPSDLKDRDVLEISCSGGVLKFKQIWTSSLLDIGIIELG